MVFLFLTKIDLLKVVHAINISNIQNVIVPWWLVQILHARQKSDRPPFWNG
jgi:hypothetical protein